MRRNSQFRRSMIHSGIFQLGEVRLTAGASNVLASVGLDVRALLVRHVAGDWGEVSAQMRKQNNQACLTFALVESRHRVMGRLLRIVTDGPRLTTTISLTVEMVVVEMVGSEVAATGRAAAG